MNFRITKKPEEIIFFKNKPKKLLKMPKNIISQISTISIKILFWKTGSTYIFDSSTVSFSLLLQIVTIWLISSKKPPKSAFSLKNSTHNRNLKKVCNFEWNPLRPHFGLSSRSYEVIRCEKLSKIKSPKWRLPNFVSVSTKLTKATKRKSNTFFDFCRF